MRLVGPRIGPRARPRTGSGKAIPACAVTGQLNKVLGNRQWYDRKDTLWRSVTLGCPAQKFHKAPEPCGDERFFGSASGDYGGLRVDYGDSLLWIAVTGLR